MGYITIDELISEDTKLGNPDIVPPAFLERTIEAKSSYIDSFLSPLYATPFSAPYPALIVDVTMEMVKAACYIKMMLSNDTFSSEEAEKIKFSSEEVLMQLRGKQENTDQPYQPLIFLTGVNFRAGIIRTENQGLLFVKDEGTGRSFYSSNQGREPLTNRFNPFYWDGMTP